MRTPRNQTELKGSFAKKGVVNLPGYAILLNETLQTPNTLGRVVQGCGAGPRVPETHPLNGSRSPLIWNVDDGSKGMVDVRGAHSHWCDLALQGGTHNPASREYDGNGAAPAWGFRVLWDAGLGSGKHQWRNCTAYRINGPAWQAGVVADPPGPSSNCDESSLYDCFAVDCEVGLQLNHEQVIGWTTFGFRFENWSGPFSRSCYEVIGGGHLTAFHTFISHGCRFLRLNNIDARYGWGENTGSFNFYSLKIDNQAGQDVCLVYVDDTPSTAWSHADVNLTGVSYSGDPTGPTFGDAGKQILNLRGGVCVTVRDSRFRTPIGGGIRWHGQPGEKIQRRVIFDGCRMARVSSATDLLDVAGSTGPIRLTLRDCIDWLGNPIPDFCDTITN
jgi:hypothetical protein